MEEVWTYLVFLESGEKGKSKIGGGFGGKTRLCSLPIVSYGRSNTNWGKVSWPRRFKNKEKEGFIEEEKAENRVAGYFFLRFRDRKNEKSGDGGRLLLGGVELLK